MPARRMMVLKLCVSVSLAVLGSIGLMRAAGATTSSGKVGADVTPEVAGSDPLYAWGFNDVGQLGDRTRRGPDICGGRNQPIPCSTSPVEVALPQGVTATAVASGGGGVGHIGYAAYAIGSDGKLYAWGDNSQGELGNGTSTNHDRPVVVALPSGVTPTAITGGGPDGYAMGSDGKLYAWGANLFGQLGDGTNSGPDHCPGPGGGFPPPPLPCSTTPVAVALPSGVSPKAITAGGAGDAYAIGSDGKLYAWGNNAGGELGDDTTTGPQTCTTGPFSALCSTTPVVVALPSGVSPTAIAGNYAIGSNGRLYAWGGSSVGELGDGDTSGPDSCTFSTPCSTSPVAVSLPSGVTPMAVAGGGRDGYVMGSDGSLYSWGYNGDGELGDGAVGPFVCPNFEPCSPTPVRVSLPTGVTPTAITGANFNGYAIGSDKRLYVWGYDGGGELGNGNSATDSLTPISVTFPVGDTPRLLASGTSSDSVYADVSFAPLTITTTSLPMGHVGQPYSATLAATGGNPPYTWGEFGGGRLPRGLSFSSGGVLSGIPRRVGTASLTFHVRDTTVRHAPFTTASATLTLQITVG